MKNKDNMYKILKISWLFRKIIGTSGSGKSALLRCLNALEDINDGDVLGYNLFDKKANINKLREDIGIVFQGFNLFPHKTVSENITMAPQSLKKISKGEAEKMLLQEL